MQNKDQNKTPKRVEEEDWSTMMMEDDELIDRINIWHFHYFVAATIVPLLQDFRDVAEFKVADIRPRVDQAPPEKYISAKDFDKMISGINLLVRYGSEEGLRYKGRRINFERGDFILELNEALHKFVNLLPYLNDRHFKISQDRFDAAPHGREVTLEELCNLDKTIAQRILPNLQAFAELSIFIPRYFKQMFFAYPLPDSNRTENYNPFHLWDKALESMVESWQWILERTPEVDNAGFEEVPEKIYHGLHLFAEYLPEMQND